MFLIAGGGIEQPQREHRGCGPEPTSSQSDQRILHIRPSWHWGLWKRLQGTVTFLQQKH